MRILHVVGARPNFIKLASVHRAIREGTCFQQTILHTGQHCDACMSDVFFRQLDLPQPDLEIGARSGASVSEMADSIFQSSQLACLRPDLMMIYGDVNSTAAGAIAGKKLGTRIGHVEAGLRSFDPTMPEEANRILADHNSDLLFTPSEDADHNLTREGIAREKIRRVGNVVIDTLTRSLASARFTRFPLLERHALVTLHRPSNVDKDSSLQQILQALIRISEIIAVVLPVHPRTRRTIDKIGFRSEGANIRLLDPLPYLDFIALERDAAVVITDSGGVQEETTFLRVPCLTLRDNTERPVTVDVGSNTIAGSNPESLHSLVSDVINGSRRKGSVPALWDGYASQRIVTCLKEEFA